MRVSEDADFTALALIKSDFKAKPTGPTAAICCIVTEEEAYLHEWIDYHLGIGFDHVYIYDNSQDFDLQLWHRKHATVKHFPGLGF
jgi:hypothetical protein